MLIKKSVWGRRYTRIVTGSPIPFLVFVLFGLILFLSLTLTTKLDVIGTYGAEVMDLEDGLVISVNLQEISKGTAYVYVHKNEAIYSVLIEDIEEVDEKSLLYFNELDQKKINTLGSHSVLIDIPRRKETLLYRLFIKGGKVSE